MRRLRILAILLLPATLPAQSIYVLDRSSSQVTFRGQALANHLVGRSQSLNGLVRLDGLDVRRLYGSVSFPVSSVRMESRSQEREMARLLGAPRERDVVFEIDSVAADTLATDGWSFFGRLTMHGVTRHVRFAGAAQLSRGRLLASGRTAVDVRDWGIEPPARFFGLVRMSPTVRLSFRAEFTRRDPLPAREVAAVSDAVCAIPASAC